MDPTSKHRELGLRDPQILHLLVEFLSLVDRWRIRGLDRHLSTTMPLVYPPYVRASSSPEHVSSWLRQAGASRLVANRVCERKITGAILLRFNSNHFVRLGMDPSLALEVEQKLHPSAPALPLPATRVVKLRRSGGKVVQDCDVYIGRRFTMGGWNLPHSKWHNPFSIKEYGTAEEVVRRFEVYVMTQPKLLRDLHELKGKTLGCWCKSHPNNPCHGDVLVKLINSGKFC